jgi:subfamily B ATP-binding cassette protein MsbA
MKVYLRLLYFASPLSHFVIPFFIYSLLSTVFGVVNFAMLVPLLDVLFGNVKNVPTELVSPTFSFDVTYFKDLFYYYFQTIVRESGKMEALKFVSAIILVCIFLTNVFRYLSIRVGERLRVNVVRNIRAVLFDKIIHLNLGYFTNQRKGDLMSRFTADASQIEESMYHALGGFSRDPFQLVAYFVVLFSISVELTFFTLIIIPLSGGIIATIVRFLKKDAKATQNSLGVITGMIDEAISGLRVIKGFNATGYINQKFQTENNHYADRLRSLAYKRESASPFSEFTGVSVVIGILLYGGSLVLTNQSELTASQFVTYIIIFSQVLRPAKSIAQTVSIVQRCVAAGERVFEVLDTTNPITDKPNATVITTFTDNITFKDVTFAYQETNVLNKISFSIKKGETVALVGQSGSGKSTIADLIPRFYDVNSGTITIDQHDIREVTLDSLRAQMGIVTQESVLFNDTIFNNIAFGNPNAKLEDVIQAAQIANAHEFIMQTENGYQTNIGDRGVKLSGGQRQRLNIARAVFKNPPILLLDEATSALDTESEKLVQEALEKLMKSRTSLVIAHRLSTIQNADRIIVLEKGEIVEIGTHSQLINNPNSRYRELKMLQEI